MLSVRNGLKTLALTCLSLLAIPLFAHAVTVPIFSGGTGTSTVPTYGQILVGGKNGEYEYVATSSLLSNSGVTSVFGRTGVVTAQNGDYTTDQVTEATNEYWTQIRFDNALAATTSIKSITTLPSLSLPYSQLTGAPTSMASSTLLGDTNTWTGLNTFGTFTVSGISTMATTTVSALNGVLYPSTTAGIAIALHQCGTNGIGTVHVVPGTYTPSTPYLPPSNCIFEGEGSSTVIRPQAAMATIDISGASNVTVRNLTIDGADNTTASGSYGIRILNSSDVRVQNSQVLRSAGFGIFPQAGANATTTRVWIQNNFLSGQGNSDVLGGGPSNSINSHVTDVYITGNTVIQDDTTNTYQNSFDIVAEQNFTISGNKFYGIVQPGSEQFPHTNVTITDNEIHPAIGKTSTQLYLSTNASASSDSLSFQIANNNIINGEIKIVGVSGGGFKNLTITGNNVATKDTTQNGISLYYSQGGTITGNRVTNAASCVYLENSGNFVVGDNDLGSCNYGIQDTTGTSTNKIGFNNFHEITNQRYRGLAQGLFINMDDASSTNPIGLTITSASASSTLRLTNTNGSGRAALEFYDPSQAAPAGVYQFENLSDSLRLFRGVLGSSGSEKFRVDSNGSTFSAFAIKATSNGVFSGSALTNFPSSGASYVNNGSNFGAGTTSPFAKLSIHANNGDTNTMLFAIASSTANATTTLFSIDNTGYASTTKFGGAGLTSCTGSNALQWNGGLFTCAAVAGGASSTLLSDSNTFSGTLNTFTNAPKLGSLTGILYGNSGTLATAASSTLFGPSTGGYVWMYSNTTGGGVWAATSSGGGGTVTSVTGTYPIISSGGSSPAISTAFGTTTGWGIANNAFIVTGATGIPYGAASSSLSLPNSALQNSSVTINGTSFALGDNKAITAASSSLLSDQNSFTGATTTFKGISLAALSLNGTILSTIASPLTTTNGALGCQTASGSQAGCLSSTDWTTFNNKLTAYDAFNHTISGYSGTTTNLYPAGFETGSSTIGALNATNTASLPYTGILKGNGAGSALTTAGSSDIVALFTGCSGSQYLGADGACHTAGGAGTVQQVNTTWPITGGPITTTGTITWGGLSTTSQPASSNVLTSNGTNGVYGTPTSTLSASSPLTGSFVQLGSSGSLGIQQANGTQNGYLSFPDWLTFNNKVATGTTFTSSNVAYFGSNGTLFNLPTTTASCSGGVSCSGFTIFGSSPVTISSFSYPWTNTTYGSSAAFATTTIEQTQNLVVSTSTIGNITAGSFTASSSITLSNLTSQNCIGTNSNGQFQAGTCSGSGASSTLLSDSNTFSGGNIFSSPNASTTIGNGTQAGGLTISGGATTTGNIHAGSGTAALPSYSFIADPKTGMSLNGVGNLDLATNGSNRIEMAGNLFYSQVSSNGPLISLATPSLTNAAFVPNRAAQNTGFSSTASTNLITDIGGVETTRWTSTAFGISTTSPYAKLSIHANNGDTNTTLFAIGSSTASATTTLFTISNTGLASTTNLAISSIISCASPKALTTDALGNVVCGTISASAASSTLLSDSNTFSGVIRFTNAATTTFSGGIEAPGLGTPWIVATSTTIASAFNLASTTVLSAKNFESVLYADNFSGSDIGASVNAAYAALPAKGGTIVIPAGSYTFSTEMNFNTAGKPVLLKCEPGARLTWNGSATSTAFNYYGGGYYNSQNGMIGCDMAGPNVGGDGTVAVQLGGSNGAPGILIQGNHIRGFNFAIRAEANEYYPEIVNNTLEYNTYNVYIERANNSGENFVFRDNNISDCYSPNKCFYSATNGTASLMLENNSIDDAQVYLEDGNSNTTITGGHFENPNQMVIGAYTYIVTNGGGFSNLTIDGTPFYNDATTTGKSPSDFIVNGGNLTVTNVTAEPFNSIAVPAFVNNYGSDAHMTVTGFKNINSGVTSFSTTTVGTLFVDQTNNVVGVASTSPGSIFAIGVTNGINFTSSTSTWNSTGGININAGCFSIRGSCVGGSGGGGTVTQVNTTAPITGGPFTTSGTIGLDTSGAWGGNAGSATKLATARAINGQNFDGTAAITVTAASSSLLGDINTWTNLQTFSYASTTAISAGAGAVGSPTITVGATPSKVGIYLAAASTLGFTNGTNGASWDGSAFYPNTNSARDLGKTANLWNYLYVNNASTTYLSANTTMASQEYVGSSSVGIANAGYFNATTSLGSATSTFFGGMTVGTTTASSTNPVALYISNAATAIGGVLIQTWTNVTNALSVVNAAGTTVFNVDTTGTSAWFGVGTSTSWTKNSNVMATVVNQPAGNGTNATSTLLIGDTSTSTSRSSIQLQNSAGATYCIFVNNSGTLTTQSGACN